MTQDTPEIKVDSPSDSAYERPASFSEKALLFLVMAAVIILDQISKFIVETWLPINQSWEPIEVLAPIFKLTHVSNTGAAFGLFPTGSSFFMIVAVVVAVVIIIYNQRLPADHYLYRVALGLQLGGALGNFIDRLRIDHVTDFLDFGPWPVFNFADMAIVSGVMLLAFLLFRENRQEQEMLSDQPETDEDSMQKTGDPTEDRNMIWNE
jgi:signal peptidase II